MKKIKVFLMVFFALFVAEDCKGQKTAPSKNYTYKNGDFNGIGKWYMDREIAHVMGFQGIEWLERSEREKEENVSSLIQNMKIKSNDVIADIGAGSGYHVFKMAPFVTNGQIYAIDIQAEMLSKINKTKKLNDVKNIETILGSEKNIFLLKNSVDKILMVDVYHEFNFPVEMISSMKSALKADGQIFLVEYRGEDPKVPIKKIHKMTQKQAIKEMDAAGFRLKENLDNLPWQHCMVFIKK
jgi:SAM-dependent methyltransferase